MGFGSGVTIPSVRGELGGVCSAVAPGRHDLAPGKSAGDPPPKRHRKVPFETCWGVAGEAKPLPSVSNGWALAPHGFQKSPKPRNTPPRPPVRASPSRGRPSRRRTSSATRVFFRNVFLFESSHAASDRTGFTGAVRCDVNTEALC